MIFGARCSFFFFHFKSHTTKTRLINTGKGGNFPSAVIRCLFPPKKKGGGGEFGHLCVTLNTFSVKAPGGD